MPTPRSPTPQQAVTTAEHAINESVESFQSLLALFSAEKEKALPADERQQFLRAKAEIVRNLESALEAQRSVRELVHGLQEQLA